MIQNNPLFSYIDSDFDSWNVVDKHPHVEKREINIKTLEKDSTFMQMFTDPENQWVTQEELIDICTNRKDELNNEGWSNLFLLKSDTDFFVARVDVGSGGLSVGVDRFEDGGVWCAEGSRRVVKPSVQAVITTKKYNSTWETWRHMKDRCNNENSAKYIHYGGRGISYCEKWETLEGFLEDMGEKPEGKSLDRIDVNGDYCKENCRWATPKEQASNRRDNVILNGETAIDASRRLGGGKNLVQQRIRNCGWSIQDAFTIPAKSLRNTKPVILNSKLEALNPSFSSEVHTTTKEEHLVRYSGDKIESLAEVVKQQDLANALKLVVDSGYRVEKI